MIRIVVALGACAALTACGSSGGGAPAAPYSTAGDQQCAITYKADSSKVDFTVTTTVAGELSYSVVGTADGSDAGTRVTAGAHPFSEQVSGFRRLTATVTADSDKTVYHCSVAPA